MKKGRFLWSAHRITERQKDGKARSIKGKQLKNSRNTVSKAPAAHPSSPRDNFWQSDFAISRAYACAWALFFAPLREFEPNIVLK